MTNPSAVSWDSDGTSFTVFDSERLAKQEFQKYFKHVNYNSFVRNLNSYGFKKVRLETKDINATMCHRYSHESFIKNNKQLLRRIKSKRRKRKYAGNPVHLNNKVQSKNSSYISLQKENMIFELANETLRQEIVRLKAEIVEVRNTIQENNRKSIAPESISKEQSSNFFTQVNLKLEPQPLEYDFLEPFCNNK